LARYTVNVTIDLRLLAIKLRESGKRFVKVHEIAYDLAVSPRTAGKILNSMARLGYLIKWSDSVYMVVYEKPRRNIGISDDIIARNL